MYLLGPGQQYMHETRSGWGFVNWDMLSSCKPMLLMVTPGNTGLTLPESLTFVLRKAETLQILLKTS